MKKKLFLSCSVLYLATCSFAGGLLTNTNQSVHFLRNPARGASIEIDAAYTNPAGLAKLPFDGFHFAFTNQSAAQTRTITSTFAPFAGFGGNPTKVFKGEATAPIIPSLQAAYKKGKWVLSGNLSVSGGGGKATFNNGLSSFESTVAIVPVVLHNYSEAINGYSTDSYMSGASFIYGAQMGGTYSINDLFSAYAGFRLNIVNNSYEGYMINDKIGFKGNLTPAGQVIAVNPAFSAFEPFVMDKNLDCTQGGWGITPILGFNFSYQQLNVGMKYEFKSSLNVENKTKENTTGIDDFKNGVNTPHDIPALFSIGASYTFINAITVSGGFHHFFDSDAKMANNKQKYIHGGTTEYLAGIEWKIDKMFLISCGGQITRQGITDDYQSDLSFALNSYSLGFGGAVNVSPKVRINIGYFFTIYDDWTKQVADYGNIHQLSGKKIPATQGKDVFSRTNKVFGAGIDFSF
ncbi:MAG: aromatic hydrocarbon degradation protein [Dysgonamonadaceae bacterium]|jgi:long-chain fatty acid transport protein|nr:aromatic hydrocarbon degradation protein [Dysgonamonadaceae bacterium]